MTSNKGFTLLEIIIATAILAFISIFTAESLNNAIRSKVRIVTKIERDALLRDALKVMSEDIRLAFNYRDVNIELHNLAQDERKKRDTRPKGKKQNPDENGETDPNEGEGGSKDGTGEGQKKASSKRNYEKKKEVVLTQFIGKKDRLDFTATSFNRSVQNSPFSSIAEVGYFIKDCRGRLDKNIRSRCLWRRISPVIDDKVEEGGTETVLLENIESLEFRYIGPGNEEEWRHDWMTDERGDAVTANKFPYAVEISLSLRPKKDNEKKLAMTVVAPLSFPNNQSVLEEGGEGEANPQAPRQ